MPDEDSPWKEILDRYLEEFLQFFFPRVHRDIDWSQEPVYLDKELQGILRGAPKGRQYLDKLVFALLVLAHLKRQEAGKDAERQLSVKKELVRLLYERGYKRGDIMHLFKFLDWLVCLPPGLDERFEGWISDYERRKSMPYVTSIERIGIRKGERIGRQEGRREGHAEGLEEAIGTVLRSRFGQKGRQLVAQVELPRSKVALRRLLEGLLAARSLDGAAALIAKAARSGTGS